MPTSLYIGSGTPAGPLDVDESSSSTPGSRLKLGVLGYPGYAHHIIAYRDICFDSANGVFYFRRNATAGDPTSFTDLVVINNGNMNVNGTLTATSKQFNVPHPIDPDHRLVHGCLEGPEHAIYYRGQGELEDGTTTVRLPVYFEAMAREEERTVQLTPLADGEGPVSALAASPVRNGAFSVRSIDDANPRQRFYWEVTAVRSDVEPLAVEIPSSSRARTGEDVLVGSDA